MAACTNNGGSRARRAVTAALVGVLSVGTVPMAALATTTAAAEDGIETLASADWYTNATVSRATDGKGATVSDPSAAVFTTGSGKYLKPIELTNSMGDTTSVDTDGYVYDYYSDSNALVASSTGTPSSVSNYFKTAAAGTYYVKITKKNTTEVAGGFYFKIADASSDVTYSFFDANNGASDTTLTYTGGAWIEANNSATWSNVGVVDSDGVEHKIIKIDHVRTPDGEDVGSATNAGTYVASVDIDGVGWKAITFTIEKLDLSKAAITIDDTDTGYADGNALLSALKIEGRTPASGIIKVSSVEGPGSYGFTAKGQYTATLVSNGNSNVTGEGTVSFSVLDYDVFSNGFTVNYGRSAAPSTIEVWLEDGESFDTSKVSVVSPDGKTVYSGDQLDIVLANSKGERVDASALANPGRYTMTVRVKASEDFRLGWIGGTSTNYNVDIKGTELVSAENLAFYLDGEPAGDSDSVTYDGKDALDRLEVKVKQGDKTFVEGTDYTLEVKKGNKVVDSAVDAGTYEITVKPVTFQFKTGDDPVFELTVNPVTVQYLYANADGIVYNDNGSVNDGDSSFDVAYTGSAVQVPGALYEINYGNGKYGYAELPSDVYNIVSIRNEDNKQVTEAVEKGDYTVKIALSDAAKGNYQLTGDGTFTFTVRAYGHFTDVAPEAWYAQAVERAWQEGYVNGIAGTDLFAPETEITRADVACILFNMAGGSSAHGDDEFSFNENGGYVTGFSDVDGHAYYAQAIAWAKAAGVVNGYDADHFGPTDKITREQFAGMLANFAKSKGDYSAPSADALSGIADAGSVDAWAVEAVSWAVENGVMGNGGYVYGRNNISRAEVAAMATNYQPESLIGFER